MRKLTALAALACACLAVATSGAQARPLQTGFLDDGSFYDQGSQIGDVWLGRAKAAGTSLVRINIFWSKIAPPKPAAGFDPRDPADPSYNWQRVDAGIRNAVAHGLTPFLTVLRAPAWAEGAGRDPSAAVGSWRPDLAQLAAFAEALAKRYSGGFPDPETPGATLPRVTRFQAWNEPNLSDYITPQFVAGKPVSPTIYRELLGYFYGAIKAVQPSATVLSAGLAPIGRPGATVGPLKFMRQLTCMSGGIAPRPTCGETIEADIWTTHPYTTGGPTHEAWSRDDVSLGDLPEMVTLLRAADSFNHIESKYRRVPFWVTEFSWDTSPPDPGALPMHLAKRWVAEALYRTWSSGASALIWLTIRDAAPPAEGMTWGETYQSGFYRFGGGPTASRPKPSLQAFRFPFVAFPERDGVRVWGRTPTSGPGPILVQMRGGGAWRAVSTLRADRAGIFHAFLPTVGGQRGVLRAWFGSDVSLPFSLTPARDRYVPPFGGE